MQDQKKNPNDESAYNARIVFSCDYCMTDAEVEKIRKVIERQLINPQLLIVNHEGNEN